ncbi:LamG domain-containing protein [Neorhodopirellula lusitana]|nr:LamG domain-containing protein [Neorhodopirellula lusitana]
MMNLHVHLDRVYSGDPSLMAMPEVVRLADRRSEQAASPRSPYRSQLWMGIAAALVVGLFLNAWVFLARGFTPGLISESSSYAETIDGVAVLTQAIAVQWDEGAGRGYRTGDALPKGVLRLKQGFAQIEFFSGATVILEGPAEMELLSSDRARFAAGKLRAFVPEPAVGFTIEGPGFDTVDLGTEFAISLDSTGQGEVHVVDGEVSIRQKSGGKIQNLLGGRAIRTTGESGHFEEIASSESTFVGRKEIAEIAEKSSRSAAESWRLRRDRWASDPDVIVYFDFEGQDPWDRRLNSAKEGAPEGAIIGAEWTQGRWPGKGALRFRNVSDRVRLNVPGEFDSVTFVVHVRLDGLFEPLNSLFMADEFGPNEPHWQIRHDGALKFGIHSVGYSEADLVLSPQDMSRWLHLAVVYDRQRMKATHYVDGELVGSTRLEADGPLRIGSAELGNWQTQRLPYPIRRLSGTIDEFLILGRSLSESEIRLLAGGVDPGHRKASRLKH